MKKMVIQMTEEIMVFHEVIIEVPDNVSSCEVYDEIRNIESIDDIKYEVKEHYSLDDFSELEVFDVDTYE